MRRQSILVLAIVVLTVTGSAWADLSDGLVACYPFNGSANDESGQGHDGTVYGATLTIDRFGNPNSAYRFDGLSTQYIEIQHNSSLDNLEQLTLAVWVSPFISGDDNLPFILGKCSQDNWLYAGYALGRTRWVYDGTFRARFRNDSGTSQEFGGVTQPQANQWYHIAVIYDGTEALLWVNGAKEGSIPFSGTLVSLHPTNAPLRIGTMKWISDNQYAWNGIIDDIRIYNRALSDSEISVLAGIQEQEAAIDISPDPLSLNSKGKWVTCYIEPPEGYSVSKIDVDSTLLEGLFEVQHCAVQDSVLMVKFNRQDVIAYIELVLEITPPDYVTLIVTGALTDGLSFAGTDVIRVTGEKEKK